jgi:hypothetical protein
MRHVRCSRGNAGTSGATCRRPNPAGAVMRRWPLALTPPADTLASALGHLGQQALAILQKGAAFVRQRDAPGGADQQLHAQPFLQRVQPPAHDGRGHAFGQRGGRSGCRGWPPTRRIRKLLEFVHAAD